MGNNKKVKPTTDTDIDNFLKESYDRMTKKDEALLKRAKQKGLLK